MIDIHTHLLPFVDDGVRDYDEAIQIIIDLLQQGVDHIYVTPHYYKMRNYLSTCEENELLFSELKQKVNQRNIDINLYLANEIKYTRETLKDIENKVVKPLLKNIYLVEFSVDISVYDITEAIHNMVAKGYTPIIAHIERYVQLSKLEDVLVLRKIGALVQVNATSVLGGQGSSIKKWIKKLIKNNYIDFIASDSHRVHPHLMKDAYLYIEKKYSKDIAEKLFNNQIIMQA